LIGTIPHIKSGCASLAGAGRHIDKRMEKSEDWEKPDLKHLSHSGATLVPDTGARVVG
jgi:hypothetical protein